MIQILKFVFFAFAVMASPGPNNLMIMHTGVYYGLKKSIPQYLGIMLAISIMLFAANMGIGYYFESTESLSVVIESLGTIDILYLVVMASQVSLLSTAKEGEAEQKEPLPTPDDPPFTFARMAVFQLVNHKVWLIAITLAGMFNVFSNLVVDSFALIFAVMLINIPAHLLWIGMGRFFNSVVTDPNQRKWLNLGFAFLLALSVAFLWL